MCKDDCEHEHTPSVRLKELETEALRAHGELYVVTDRFKREINRLEKENEELRSCLKREKEERIKALYDRVHADLCRLCPPVDPGELYHPLNDEHLPLVRNERSGIVHIMWVNNQATERLTCGYRIGLDFYEKFELFSGNCHKISCGNCIKTFYGLTSHLLQFRPNLRG